MPSAPHITELGTPLKLRIHNCWEFHFVEFTLEIFLKYKSPSLTIPLSAADFQMPVPNELKTPLEPDMVIIRPSELCHLPLRLILVPVPQPPLPVNCNLEHPPLVTVIVPIHFKVPPDAVYEYVPGFKVKLAAPLAPQAGAPAL